MNKDLPPPDDASKRGLLESNLPVIFLLLQPDSLNSTPLRESSPNLHCDVGPLPQPRKKTARHETFNRRTMFSIAVGHLSSDTHNIHNHK